MSSAGSALLLLAVLLFAPLAGAALPRQGGGVRPTGGARNKLDLTASAAARSLLERRPVAAGVEEEQRTTPRRLRSWTSELEVPSDTTWEEYAEFLALKEDDMSSVTATLPSGWEWDRYHDTNGVEELLSLLESEYPDIASQFSLGTSVEGRALQGIKLGKNPELTVGVPEVKLVGNMHGDETAACEMLLRLAWDLCRRYANPSEDTLGVARLLDTTSIYILPTMNPDGYDARPRVRSNANGLDLNRAFPRLGDTGDGEVLGGSLQPEVEALMEWTKAHNFPLSANLHGGALVSNYPFDACDKTGWETDCPTPEDPTPKNIALSVADLHVRMSSKQVSGFTDGITRGSVWYPVLGGMQDWVWFATQGMEITLEVHEDKEPTDTYAGRLPWLFLEMRDPLLNFVGSVHHSFQGRVTHGETGVAVNAKVLMVPVREDDEEESEGRKTQTASSGAFTRVVTPGLRYCFTVKARGLKKQTGVFELPAGSQKDAHTSELFEFQLSSRSGGRHYLGTIASLSKKERRRAWRTCRPLLKRK